MPPHDARGRVCGAGDRITPGKLPQSCGLRTRATVGLRLSLAIRRRNDRPDEASNLPSPHQATSIHRLAASEFAFFGGSQELLIPRLDAPAPNWMHRLRRRQGDKGNNVRKPSKQREFHQSCPRLFPERTSRFLGLSPFFSPGICPWPLTKSCLVRILGVATEELLHRSAAFASEEFLDDAKHPGIAGKSLADGPVAPVD